VVYWRVVVKYGHLGFYKEISVARYLQTNKNFTIVDVWELAIRMPGVKNRGVRKVEPIELLTCLQGKKKEKENFYLQKLMNHNPSSDYRQKTA